MPVRKLKEFRMGIRSGTAAVAHSQAFTSQEIAASAHIPGRELAKTVMIKVDGKMAMAVILAINNKVDFCPMGVTGGQKVELANENEFRYKFPECEICRLSAIFTGWMYSWKSVWRRDEMIAFIGADTAHRTDQTSLTAISTGLCRC